MPHPPTTLRAVPSRYDASTSSTEYTKQLRKKENEDEAHRRSALLVTFADGVTRCVKFDLETRGSEWVFDREWASKLAGAHAAEYPLRAHAAEHPL